MAYDGTLKFDTAMDTKGFQKGTDGLTGLVKGLTIFKVLEKGFQMVGQSIDAAVTRYDTLNRFPKILGQMGYSADKASASTKKLSDGIQGLPTTLDGIVNNTKQLITTTGGLDSAVDTALALNNAFYASGSTAEEASRGFIQYNQMLANGKVDAVSWRTLNETMNLSLQKVAESFGFAGTSAKQDLYAALRDGIITFDQVNAKFVELNDGVGGFAEMAKTATGGIGTAWTNMQTAIVRGTTSIITALDTGLSQTKFKSIENVIVSSGKGINTALVEVASVTTLLVSNLDVLAISAIAVGTAFGTYKVVKMWNTAATTAKTVSEQLKITQQKLVIAVGKTTAAETTADGVTKKATFSKLALAASTAKQVAAEAQATAEAARSKAMRLQQVAAEKAAEAAIAKETAATMKGTYAQAARAEADKTAFIAKNAEANATIAATTADEAEATAKRLSTAAQNEQNVSVGIGTAVIGYLTGSITLQALATAVATVATNIFSMALKALPLVGVAAAIGVVIAAIVALVKWVTTGSKEFQQQKQEVEDLSEKQKQLATSIADSEQAFNNEIAAIDATAQAGRNALSALTGMIDANGRITASHEAARRAVDDLNKAYPGLNLSYEEETRCVSASAAEITKYVTAKEEIAKTTALDERRVKLANEQAQVEAELAAAEQKRIIIEQNGNLTHQEKIRLYEDLDKTIKGHKTTLSDLKLDTEANNKAIEASDSKMATNAVNAYEAMNGARTSDGLNLKQLAKLHGTTTEQILSDMGRQGISMDEWAIRKAATMTEEGLNVEQLAEKWGMTTSEVEAYMDEWGLELDEFGKEMDATHTKAGLSLEDLAAKWGTSTEEIQRQMTLQNLSLQEWSDQQDSKTQEVINSFEEIPKKYDKTANEMINILTKNAERYSKWTTNIATLSQTMSADAIAELQKLGPEANSAIEEMIANPEKAAKFEESIAAVMSAGANGAEIGAADPRFGTAGAQIGTGIGEGVASSTEVNTAATQMMQKAATAADAAVTTCDFSAVGRKIATDMLSGITNADMSGIATSIANAIRSGTGSVTAAATAMSTSAQTVVRTMSTQNQSTTAQMMTGMNSAIISRAGTIRASITSMGNGAITSLRNTKAQAESVVKQMMDGMNAAIVAKTPLLTGKTTQLANGIVKSLKAMVSGGKEVANQMMDGILVAMNAKAAVLYAKANEIATTIAKTMADALAVKSPSRVMIDIFQYVMMGIYKGMESMEGRLYRQAEGISEGIAERLTVTPVVATTTLDRLRAISPAHLFQNSTLAVATAGAAPAGNTTTYYFDQTINSPKYTSASENSREAEALLRRADWKIK